MTNKFFKEEIHSEALFKAQIRQRVLFYTLQRFNAANGHTDVRKQGRYYTRWKRCYSEAESVLRFGNSS